MIDGFAVIAVSVLLTGFGAVVGTKVGDELSKRVVTVREYWRFTALVMVVGVFASMLVFATGFMVLATFVIGALAGAIAGLKMGFGESTGFWRLTDRFFSGPKQRQPKRAHADASTREKARRARKAKTAQPELMSVDMQGESTKNSNHS